jgi:hypothetical protein
MERHNTSRIVAVILYALSERLIKSGCDRALIQRQLEELYDECHGADKAIERDAIAEVLDALEKEVAR